jgi:hypothetical protein
MAIQIMAEPIVPVEFLAEGGDAERVHSKEEGRRKK